MLNQFSKKVFICLIAGSFTISSAFFASAESNQSGGSVSSTSTATATHEPPSAFPYFLVALAAAFVIAPYGMARILSQKNEKKRPRNLHSDQ